MPTKIAVACGVVLMAGALAAQTLPPNPAGVFAAHTHLITADLAASTAFWSAAGSTPAQIGTMNGVRMPGLYVMFQLNRGRGAAANAAAAVPAPESSVGSVVEAIGIKVKNLKETVGKLSALGATPDAGPAAGTVSVMSPEKVKVLLTEDPSMAAPSTAMTNEWLMKVPSPAEAAAWYQKWFGASIATQGADTVARIPGMNLHFVQTTAPMAGTHGRALDHIGFDVVDLPALVTKMQAEGVTVNTPYRTMSLGFLTGIAFVTDPWGTYIELNQGYDGH